MLRKLASCILFLVLAVVGSVYGQVKIGDGTAQGDNTVPNPNAVLDLSSMQRGVLFPRVELAAVVNPAPLTEHVAGMMVYNTSTQNDVVPAIYYNDGTKWVFVGAMQGSNLSYNPTTYVITYVDNGGSPQTINLVQAIKGNETTTLLIKESEGRYVFYNEASIDETGNPITGSGVVIDIPASVINQFEEVVNGGPVTVNGTTYNTIEEYIENIVAANETNTTLIDNNDGTYTYTSEDGTVTVVDVPASVINQFEEVVNGGPVTVDGTTYNTIEEYIENIVAANETNTTLIDNNDGTYTYTSEDGTVTVVDIPASVINQFEEVVNGGPVTVNGNTYSTIEEYIENIVAANETNTTLIDNNDGTYTYTSEDGTVTVVDVPASVVNQFEEVVHGGPVTVNGNTYSTIEEYIENIVAANETNTTLIDNNDGTYTYTSEDGTVTTVDIPASVINQFEEVVNGGPVTVDGNTYSTIEEYIENIVAANETNTTLIDNNDGTYTYTSEDGTVTTVDIPASVINQFEEVVNGGPVTVDGNTYSTIEEYIENIVAANETNTTLIDNNDGTYTYTSEDGTVTVVDVPASVVNQFEEVVNGGPVTVDGNTYSTIEEYIENIVAANETNTTLIDNNDGTYTYTSEDGTVTTVDIPASVINQFEEVVNGGPVTVNGTTYNTIEEYIENIVAANETNTTLIDNNDGTYTYTSEDGTVTTVDIPASVINQFEEVVNGGPVTVGGNTYTSIEEYIENIVAANETNTTLIDNNDGTYTYTSEDGTVTVVDVPASVVNQFEEVVNGGPVTVDGNTYSTIEEYIENIVAANETNTTLIDNNDGTYTYTSEDGTVTTVDIPASVINQFEEVVNGGPVTVDGNTYSTIEEYIENIVAANETNTTLIDNNDGTYTYTSEDGTVTTVDIPASVINQFEEVVNGGPVTVDGNTYSTIEEYIENIVAANETNTTLIDNNDGTYTYTSEDGTVTTIDIPASVVNQFEEVVNGGPVTVGGNTYTSIEEYIENIVAANETNTTLIDNNDGTYTYTSEDGTVTVVDVPASVINQFEEVVNGGPVTVNGTTYNTIEEYIENIVAANETNTTLIDNNDGTYTYTSEDGTVTTVDIPASVINQFEEVVNGGPVTVNGTTYNTIEEYIENIVAANETNTTLIDNNDGTYTYTSEDGTVTTVDIPASVINQFEEVVNGGPVTVGGNTYTSIEEYIENIVAANETNTTLIDNNDGTYTYTSEDGTVTVVDVPASVVNQFEEVVNGGPVTVNGTTYNTIEEYIENIVAANETNTTLIDNNDGTYTYTSEDGTVTVVDVPASVVNQFEEVVNGGPVTVNGNTYSTIEEYIENIVAANETNTTLIDNNDGTYTYTSEDGTVTTVDIPASVINQFEEVVNGGPVTVDGNTYSTIEEYIENIVAANETNTTLIDNNDGTYTYTSEDGTVTTIDIPASVINQFEEVVNGGPVTVDGNTYSTIEEYIENIVAANETNTTLIDNNDGTYTYTSEDGTVTVVDVPASVVNQFEEVVNGGPVTVNGTTYNTIEEYIENIVAANETVTTLVDNGDGTVTYTNETNIPVTINMANGPAGADGIDGVGVVSTVDNGDGTFTINYTDGSSFTSSDLTGPEGPVGPNGNPGPQGEPGMDGVGGVTQAGTGVSVTGAGTVADPYVVSSTITDTDDQTITDLSITGGVLSTTIENGNTQTLNLISGDAGNGITAGTDGALFVPQATAIEADNGLHMEGGKVYLGGTLLESTIITQDDNFLRFSDIQQTTFYNDAGTGIHQDAGTGNRASMTLSHGGVNSFSMYSDNNSDVQMYASNNATKLLIGTHNITGAAAPIDFSTSAGGGAASTIKARITGTGEMGVGTINPTERLDIGADGVRIRDINTTAYEGNANTDKVVVADADGVLKTVEVADLASDPLNIYNADGLLTGTETTRNLGLNGKSLRFNGTDRRTHWDSEGRIHQTATNPAIDAAMGFHNGGANLWLQQWNSNSAILATDNSTALELGTHATQVSAPITFSTSAGSGALATEKMRITGEGEISFNNYPNTRNDSGTTAVENILYTDENGNILSADISALAPQSAHYRATSQNTGKEWIGGEPVFEVVGDITLATNSNQVDLSGSDIPTGATVIGVRFISKTTGSISTNIIEYDQVNRTLILGTAGSMTTLHPAGDYYIIVEYTVVP